MPDPLFHLSTALLPKALLGGRHTGAFVLGALLPDLASRLPGLALERLLVWGAPLPGALLQPWFVMHTPIGAVTCAVIAAHAFEERDRAGAAAWLLGGVALHLLCDVLQFHHDGGYALLFPFTLARFQIGVIGSESTVPWSAPVALASVGAWAARVFRRPASERR